MDRFINKRVHLDDETIERSIEYLDDVTIERSTEEYIDDVTTESRTEEFIDDMTTECRTEEFIDDLTTECRTEEFIDDLTTENASRIDLLEQVGELTRVEHVTPILRAVASDISSTACCEISRPLLKLYPKTQYGTVQRSFQFKWFKEYEWLEYSQLTDRAYCCYCRFFGRVTSNEVWVISGYCNWKNATTKGKGMNAHNSSESHVMAGVLWAEYHKTLKQGTIFEKVGCFSEKQKIENRHFVRSVAEVILLCALQGIALRGHREESNDAANNRGNFLEVMHLVGRHDKVIATRLADGPRNAKYTSHIIQDQILHIMANLLRNSIIDELKAAKFFPYW